MQILMTIKQVFVGGQSALSWPGTGGWACLDATLGSRQPNAWLMEREDSGKGEDNGGGQGVPEEGKTVGKDMEGVEQGTPVGGGGKCILGFRKLLCCPALPTLTFLLLQGSGPSQLQGR